MSDAEYKQLLDRIAELENEVNKLRQKERQLHNAMKSLDNNPDGVFWTDGYGRLLYVNQAACDELGYTEEELLEMSVGDFDAGFPKDIWHPRSEFMQASMRGENAYLQTLHRHREGRLIPVEIVNTMLESQGEGLGCSIVRDITARVEAEKRLQETNDRLVQEIEERTRAEEMLQTANMELEQRAFTDQLTGAWNRRFFVNVAENEMKRARRHKHVLSMLLIDIDNFKNINDEFGHQVGDKVLAEFSHLIKSGIRDTDLWIRWGGEEFIVLALQSDERYATQLAERLRNLVAKHDFQVFGNITVSIGVTQFQYKEDLDAWIRRADEALYKAKYFGRNRVEHLKAMPFSTG